MKSTLLVSCLFALGLTVSAPTVVFAHVGHGDEFQAEGGINRVPVKAQTDALLGIVVTPIAPAADGSATVFIPITAVVDANGKPMVFVQYENFYEPVPVKTGATKGELIEIVEGLSVGEKLVTHGSLSLFAESRKTQTATTAATTHAQADAQGIPHGHDANGNLAQAGETTTESGGFPLGLVAAVGGGVMALGLGVVAFMRGGSQKKRNS